MTATIPIYNTTTTPKTHWLLSIPTLPPPRPLLGSLDKSAGCKNEKCPQQIDLQHTWDHNATVAPHRIDHRKGVDAIGWWRRWCDRRGRGWCWGRDQRRARPSGSHFTCNPVSHTRTMYTVLDFDGIQCTQSVTLLRLHTGYLTKKTCDLGLGKKFDSFDAILIWF